MAIISQETWDKFTEEEKHELQTWHEVLAITPRNERERLEMLDCIFGKENLQPKPKIKTWKDMGLSVNEQYCKLDLALGSILPTTKDDKLRLKIKATFKIAKLIELGYGGMVTEEEWRNLDIPKYLIEYHPTSQDEKYKFQISCDCYGEAEIATKKEFIAFHTKQQAEEFMSYPENVVLVKQYNMI